MKIGEFFVALGIKGDDSGLKTFSNGMSNLVKTSMQTKIAIGGVVAAIAALVYKSTEAAVEFSTFTLQTGLSAEKMKQWQYVAETNNVSGSELISTIKGIQKAQAEVLMGTGNIRPFALLGISPHEDPFAVLEKLRTKIKDMNPAIASSIMGQMGVGQNFLNVLRAGNIEFDKTNQKLFLTGKEYDKIMQINKAIKELMFYLANARDRFVLAFQKPLLDAISFLKNLSRGFVEVVDLIGQLINKFSILRPVVLALGAAMLIAFNAPMAGIMALFLLIEDFYVYLHGGKSVIGDFLKYFKLEGLVDELGKFLKSLLPLFEALKPLGKFVQDILIVAFKAFREIVVDIAEGLTVIIESINKLIALTPKLKQFIEKKYEETTGEQGTNVWQELNPFRKGGELDLSRMMPSFSVPTKAEQILENRLQKGDTSFNTNFDIKLNVSGVENPKTLADGIMTEVRNNWDQQMSQVYYQSMVGSLA